MHVISLCRISPELVYCIYHTLDKMTPRNLTSTYKIVSRKHSHMHTHLKILKMMPIANVHACMSAKLISANIA